MKGFTNGLRAGSSICAIAITFGLSAGAWAQEATPDEAPKPAQVARDQRDEPSADDKNAEIVVTGTNIAGVAQPRTFPAN